jgi:hypothetical protein
MHRNNPLDRSAGRPYHGFVAPRFGRSQAGKEPMRARSVHLMRIASRRFAILPLVW